MMPLTELNKSENWQELETTMSGISIEVLMTQAFQVRYLHKASMLAVAQGNKSPIAGR
jgi:hypothetical protein